MAAGPERSLCNVSATGQPGEVQGHSQRRVEPVRRLVEHHQQRSFGAATVAAERRLRVDMHHGVVATSIGAFEVQQICVEDLPMGIAPVYPALQESFALWSVVQTVAAIAGSDP